MGSTAGQQQIQTEIGKDLDLHQAYNIVRTTRSCGIRPVTGFICGYPMERKEDFEETLRGYFETLRLGGFRAICSHSALTRRRRSTRPTRYLDVLTFRISRSGGLGRRG